MRKSNNEPKYSYWTIEKVENGYLLKNVYVTVVFNDKDDLLDYLEAHTK